MRLPEHQIQEVMSGVVIVVGQRNELIALDIAKGPQGPGQCSDQLRQPGMGGRPRRQTDHDCEQRTTDLETRLRDQLGIIGKEGPAIGHADCPNHGRRPRVANGFEEHLEDTRFILTSRKGASHRTPSRSSVSASVPRG